MASMVDRIQPPGRVQRLGAAMVGIGAGTYVGLKAAWVAGAAYGVTSRGDLTTTEWRWVNVETGAVGVLGLVLAAALWSRWGLRLPWWLVAPPLWCGVGLLAPFVVLLPVGLVLALAGHPVDTASPDPGDPQLAGWVFAMVYSGFAAVALGLAVAVPAYVRTRYGHRVAGRLGDEAPSRFPGAAWAGVVGAAMVATVHLAWALGVAIGRTHPPSPLDRAEELVFAGLALLTAAAAVVWTRRGPAQLHLAWPALALWLGSGWMLSQSLSLPQLFSAERWAPTGLTYAAYVVVTALTVAAGVVAGVGGLRAAASSPAQPARTQPSR